MSVDTLEIVEVSVELKPTVAYALRLYSNMGKPEEVGGVILVDGEVVRLPNMAPVEEREHFYETDIEIRSDIAYFWHSHPSGPDCVSNVDKQMMSNIMRRYGFEQPWIIVGPNTITAWTLRGATA